MFDNCDSVYYRRNKNKFINQDIFLERNKRTRQEKCIREIQRFTAHYDSTMNDK